MKGNNGKAMEGVQFFDVIIIGGSFAGLSAGLTLGRSRRKVLIIDSANPCNKQTPRSHNFITHDGERPLKIIEKAKTQTLNYPTIQFLNDSVITINKLTTDFEVETKKSKRYSSKKLLIATGVIDVMPEVKGFAECWGISVLHCPYCHGYEVKEKPTGVLANGEEAFATLRLLTNWTSELLLFTNGPSTLTESHREKLATYVVKIIETEVEEISHSKGKMEKVLLKNGDSYPIAVMYAKILIVQHDTVFYNLNCKLNERGYIETDETQKTSVPGVYAAGDVTTMDRSISAAVASGTKAGMTINSDLVVENF